MSKKYLHFSCLLILKEWKSDERKTLKLSLIIFREKAGIPAFLYSESQSDFFGTSYRNAKRVIYIMENTWRSSDCPADLENNQKRLEQFHPFVHRTADIIRQAGTNQMQPLW